MKSTMLAIVITMFISALYSFQNLDPIKVKFFVFEGSFPQGVWEVVLFCAGVVLMWIFSMFASLETRGKYKKLLKEKDEKLKAADEEKKSIIASVAAASKNSEPTEVTPTDVVKTDQTASQSNSEGSGAEEKE